MKVLKVLVACEFSGIVRDAFAALGHDAWSCDLLPSERPGNHIQGDVLTVLSDGWDLMIAHPPCTYLSNSGVRHLYVDGKKEKGRNEARWRSMELAAEFFRKLLDAPIPRLAIENPVMHRYGKTIIGREQNQTIQPYQFGEDASKATCLWLKNLPPLVPTDVIKKARYANQTASGQNKLAPSPDRWKDRSRTYEGIAAAFAYQWGGSETGQAESLPAANINAPLFGGQLVRAGEAI